MPYATPLPALPVQVGGIYTLHPFRTCELQDIDNNLDISAWGHRVLVLEELLDDACSLRIMTITTDFRDGDDWDDFIPFLPLRKEGHAMRLRTRGGLKFVYGSYLRIADEYFIQDTRLKAYVGYVPIEGDQGLEELLDVLDELDEEEDSEDGGEEDSDDEEDTDDDETGGPYHATTELQQSSYSSWQ